MEGCIAFPCYNYNFAILLNIFYLQVIKCRDLPIFSASINLNDFLKLQPSSERSPVLSSCSAQTVRFFSHTAHNDSCFWMFAWISSLRSGSLLAHNDQQKCICSDLQDSHRASVQQMIALCCCLLLLCPSETPAICSQQLLVCANIWFGVKLGQSLYKAWTWKTPHGTDSGEDMVKYCCASRLWWNVSGRLFIY